MTWVLANVFLTVAVIDDILYRKFHNFLFVAFSAAAFVAIVLNTNLTWASGVGGFCLAAGLILPLVLLGIIGAGDMKFMMAFGLLVGPHTTFWVFAYGLVWGAVMGLIKSIVSGQLGYSLTHIYNFSFSEKSVKASTKIPFTVALFLGWLTWLQVGGAL